MVMMQGPSLPAILKTLQTTLQTIEEWYNPEQKLLFRNYLSEWGKKFFFLYEKAN